MVVHVYHLSSPIVYLYRGFTILEVDHVVVFILSHSVFQVNDNLNQTKNREASPINVTTTRFRMSSMTRILQI